MDKLYVAVDTETYVFQLRCFMSKDLDKLKAHVVKWVNENYELADGEKCVDFNKDYTGFEIGEVTNID